MSTENSVVITQLVVDASGAKTGVAEFEASMDAARAKAAEGGESVSSFDAVLKRWTQSLASTDPVLRAQVAQQAALNRQLALNKEAVSLGITTGDAAKAQLERINQKYGEYVQAAESATAGSSKFGQVLSFTGGQVAGFIGVLSVERVVEFGKQLVDNAAQLKAQSDQVGVSIEALQAYRAVLESNGVTADQADQLLSRLTHSIGDALRQSGAARDGFNQLGISIDTLRGGAEATLPALAKALLAIPDPTRRAALEVDEFGRSGQLLEAALHALIDPTSTLIEKEKALGQVLGTDVVTAADQANNKLDENWRRLKNDLTPAAVGATGALADLIEKYREWRQLQDLGTIVTPSPTAPKVGLGMFGSGGILGHSVAPATGAANGNAPGGSGGAGDGYQTRALDEYIAKQKISASIAMLGPIQQAETNALIDAANAKLQDGAAYLTNRDGSQRKFVESAKEAVSVLGEGTAKTVEGNAATIARGAAWNKVRETYQSYLASLGEEARIAGESTAQREQELAVIKAAQVAQAAAGVEAKDRVQTYDLAKQKLTELQGAQAVADVQAREAAKQTAGFQKQITDQVTLSNIAAANGRDDRELALQIAQKQLDLGRQLTDQEKQQLQLIQQRNDAARLRDYTDQLQDEASLAGLSADEREREAAVLDAMRITHGKLSDAQKQGIEGIIATRQETERWRQVVDGTAGDFQNFFFDLETKGKASFGDLARAIESEFAQLLAWMASQALIQPIIVPMIGELAGTFGLQMPGGIGGGAYGAGGGPLGLLSNGASLANSAGMFGSSGGGLFSGVGATINSIGGALGFSTVGTGSAVSLGSVAGAGWGSAGGAFDLGSISSATPALPGSIFGATSLGGFLGGAGLGALAGNLVFGNKNDASMGSMGGALAGAAIGSIIPGVGTIIGGLIGGLAGGGLGSMTGSSNQGAIANFSNGGASSYLFKQGGGNNGQLSTQAAKTISDAITTLQQSGVDVGLGNITGLSIGSDKSYVYDSAGGKQKLAGGDPNAVVSAILERILPSASASTPEAQAVLSKYLGQGGLNASNLSQFESDLGSAKNFADSLANLKQSDAALTDAGQKLSSINKQYDQLVGQAQQLGLDVSNLTDAKNGAIANLLDGYIGQLNAFTPPTEQTSQWKQAMDTIATAEENATEAANALGSGLDRVQAAAAGARQAVANTFDSQIGAAIGKLADPVAQAFDDLIASQQQRLADAQTVSANIDQVNRLSNLELTQFFQGLTGDQLGLLGSERGLYSNGAFSDALTAANDLQALNGSISDLTTNAQNAAAAASQAASDWGSAKDALSKASTALLISDSSLSPGDAYHNSAAQFATLRNQALGGDVTSANDLASFASDFLKTSFNYNGSTTAYGNDLAYVQTTLNSLASYAGGQQSLAQRQADSAAQAVTVLQSINQTVASQKTETVAQLEGLRAEVANLAAQIAAANLQARHV